MRDAGRDDEVLPCRDDLSCGPIDSDDQALRVAWWARFHEAVSRHSGTGSGRPMIGWSSGSDATRRMNSPSSWPLRIGLGIDRTTLST
jgi:hypothetical protein